MTTINPLSTPKGVKLVCELCSKVAYYQCQFCRVTFYCSKEHQATDWQGVHVKICQLLVPLRTPSKVLGSEEERNRREKNIQKIQLGLYDLAKTEAAKHLNESQYELAIPAALQALKFSVELWGPGSIELVPSYLLLGEASIGLGRLRQAEEYLALAKYAILKKPDCSYLIRSQLHRNFGKLYAKEGKNVEALKSLANDIYFCSLEYGPEHATTAGGYYQMANIFLTESNIDSALAMYQKVSQIWSVTLKDALKMQELTNVEILDEAVTAECLVMLNKILETGEDRIGRNHLLTAESHILLGQVHRYVKNYKKGREHTEIALTVFSELLGDDHPTTEYAKKCIDFFDSVELIDVI